jgi:hypothetical protein
MCLIHDIITYIKVIYIMAKNSENFNKQITAYVVLSASLVMPAVIGEPAAVSADPMIVNPVNIQAPMLRYAGPPNPAVDITPVAPVVRYAGPPNPAIIDAVPVNIKTPDTGLVPVMRYAGPPNPAMYSEATKNAVPASLSTQASQMNVQINSNLGPINNNVNNFGGIQIAPDHFIFK